MLGKFLAEISEEQCKELPPIPEEPLPSDCCGNGCRVCVVDVYEREVHEWIEKAKNYLAKEQGNETEGKTLLTLSVGDKQCLSKRSFIECKIVSRSAISPDAFVFRFALPSPLTACDRVLPGEHLIAKVQLCDGNFVTREYTPITDITVTEYFDVLIKVYPDGKFTSHAKTWKIGDQILWKGPFGYFDHVVNKYSYILMIAGGTGIAPMVSITQQVLDNEDDETRIILLYSNKQVSDILLKEKLDEFQDFWNFEVIYILTRESQDCSELRYQDQRFFGRVERPFLSSVLARVSSTNVRFLVCGPALFNTDIERDLLYLGFSKDNIVVF